ncbi:MAG: hypothetical protein ACI4MJ_07540 [Aristaeellaceae bacterium]
METTCCFDGIGRVTIADASLSKEKRGIPITLVTRHNGDIHADWAKSHICESLFAAIVEVDKGQRKSACIHPGKKARDIDNSFAERMEIARRFGIPALGVESVEAMSDNHQ